MPPLTATVRASPVTVPECARCSAIWQDAEDHFRSVMALAATDHNEHADDQWDGPISRAHRRAEDGWDRMGELLKWVVERDTPKGKEYVLHPADIEKVLLVVRKMVRGLCHYHGLATQVADHQVLAMQYEHSPRLEPRLLNITTCRGCFVTRTFTSISNQI